MVDVNAVAAQQRPRAIITGTVRDGSDGAALPGATVGVASWGAATDAAGRFTLRLPPGEWPLRVGFVGYAPLVRTVRVEVGDTLRLALSLSPGPILLGGLTVEAAASAPVGVTRLDPAALRQVPSLAEADVFRAVTLLPLVSQPNDLKGRLHLMGGASDETGVRLDGFSMWQPYHLLGLFGAFNTAALGSADLALGHLPAGVGESLSGTLDLTPRRPRQSPGGEVHVSLLTGGATYAGVPRGRTELLASARLTYIDQAARLVGQSIPTGFADGVLKLTQPLGDSLSPWRVEALGFLSRDYFTRVLVGRDGSDSLRSKPAAWAEHLLGARLIRDQTTLVLRLEAGFDEASVRFSPASFSAAFVDNRLRRLTGRAEADWRPGPRWRLVGGAEAMLNQLRYTWSAGGLADEIFSPNTPVAFARDDRQPLAAGYGTAEYGSASGRYRASVGARLWLAPAPLTGEGFRTLLVEPRLAFTIRPSVGWSATVAYDRRHQFTAQTEEPLEGSIGTPLFLLDLPRRADIGSLALGWSRSPESGWLGRLSLDATAFAKAYRNDTRLLGVRTTPTGEALDPYPEFERRPARAVGLGVQATLATRQDRLTVQMSASAGRAEAPIAGIWRPTSWDVSLSGSTLVGLRVGHGWRLTTVFQGRLGVPSTPVVGFVRTPIVYAEQGTDPNRLRRRFIYGEPNSIRVPPYRRLDLGLHKSWQRGRRESVLSIQVLNVLARGNPIDYEWERYYQEYGNLGVPSQRYRTGLPILPTIGWEMTW